MYVVIDSCILFLFAVNLQTTEHVSVKNFELLKVLGTGGKFIPGIWHNEINIKKIIWMFQQPSGQITLSLKLTLLGKTAVL